MKLSIIAVFCFLAMSAAAQQHYNTWLRGTAQFPVSGIWSADGELQYRRQNGFENTNPLAQPLLYSFRTRVYYQHTKAIRFAFSPLAYFNYHKVIRSDSDHLAPTTNEYRITGFLELTEPISTKLDFHNREAVEYRIYNDGRLVTRLRILNGIVYNPAKRWTVNAYHELLLNVAGTPSSRYLDQSRLAITGIYKLTKQLKIEIGYIHISKLSSSTGSIFQEHNLVLNLTAAF
jgi:hypothetical protein